jgi:hypothetical protein
MDHVLRLIDALRERGAIEISTPEVSVKFATPMLAAPIPDPETPTVEKAIDFAEVERLMYVETSKM